MRHRVRKGFSKVEVSGGYYSGEKVRVKNLMIHPFRNSVELSMELSNEEKIVSYVFSNDGKDVTTVVFEDELLAIALDKNLSEEMQQKRRLYIRFKSKNDYAYFGKYTKELHRIVFERET